MVLSHSQMEARALNSGRSMPASERDAKKLAARGLPSTKVYHFTAVEILTSILK